MMTATAATHMDDVTTGGRLVSVDGRTLPLLGARLTARARGGLARTVLEQRFRNRFDEPLRVTYLFPLPHDGAVSGFAFRVGERRIVGEIDRRDAARERFEEAVASGRTAGIVDQERGGVFTQELGNVPGGAEVVAELTVDQRLAWVPAGAWEWRFPMAVAPRYPGAEGRVPDAARTSVDVADGPLPARLTATLRIEDALAPGRSPESPSHAVAFRPDLRAIEASLPEAGVPLDRDVVVRWPVAAPRVGASLETFRPASGPLAGSAFGLLTLVPPAPGAAAARFPRDLVVLVDTSGSMAGAPLEQARRVVSALVESLGEDDTLELIAFSTAPRRWRPEPVRAAADARRSALAWLDALRASGGTEMRDAIVEALRGLRADAQRQVLLVTDGQIGFEAEIVGELLHGLPERTRLHTLGVGSAVNRSLTGPAARAGRGTESIVGIGEDVERAVRTLVSRMEAPVVTELELSGDVLVERVPARLPDLFGAGPALVALRLRPEGGTLAIRGKTPGGTLEHDVVVLPSEPGSGSAAVAALFGREAAEDLEARLAAGEDARAIDALVERLGLDHQIATRVTSWVAVSDEPSVDPTRPTRRVRVPQELPHAMSVEGLGLRQRNPLRAIPAGLFSASARPTVKASRRDRATVRPAQDVGLAPSAPAPAPPLRGRVVLDRGGELVVEVTLSAELDWSPPAQAMLVGGGGLAIVDLERTTAAGTLGAGHVLRLVLRHGRARPLGDALLRVECTVGGSLLSIGIEHGPHGGGPGDPR